MGPVYTVENVEPVFVLFRIIPEDAWKMVVPELEMAKTGESDVELALGTVEKLEPPFVERWMELAGLPNGYRTTLPLPWST